MVCYLEWHVSPLSALHALKTGLAMVSTGTQDTPEVKRILRFDFTINQLDVVLRNQRSGFLTVSNGCIYWLKHLVFDGEDEDLS
jgi:hypothetical protein